NNVYNLVAILKTAKEKMTHRINYTSKRPPSRDSYQTPNYANLVPQNPLQTTAQSQQTFVNAFHRNIEIEPQDPDQTIQTPEEVPPNAITATRALLIGLSGQKTSQIDIYAEEPSDEQVVEARQRARAATDLVTRKRPPKHNNPPAQPILAFDHILADLETKLLQQYRLIQVILTQIMNQDWTATLKLNLCTFKCIYDLQGKHDASMDGYDRIRELTENRSLRVLRQTEGAHPELEDTLLTRIVGLMGELDQEPKKNQLCNKQQI
ncbi:MAG: hypothetical protein EZS28_011874, partial [Streblomastix strix]